MIPVATIEQMRECDRVTIEELGLPGLVLMENASRSVAGEAVDMLDRDMAGAMVTVVCGRGNNGGDGFAVARHLGNAGADVRVLLVGEAAKLKGDALFNCGLYKKIGGTVNEIHETADLRSGFGNPDLIVDGLLGTGFKGPVRGIYREVIDGINSAAAPVLAIDIPSGVEGDSGIAETAVRARRTVTFGLPKPGLLLPPGREFSGEVIVADIGIPPRVVQEQNIRQHVVEKEDVRLRLPRLRASDHKGRAGHVFILAGSPGLTGAAVLAAEASMRGGAGLTAVGIPRSLNPVLEMKLTEAMTLPLAENDSGGLCGESLAECSERLQWASVVAFGPGVGRHRDTAQLLKLLLDRIDKPLVIDADGLNLLAETPDLLKNLPRDTVLTPHPGEFSRLTGLSIAEIASDRIRVARRWAEKWGVVLVLKGSPSITALPDGEVFINPTGNAGMATGGTGDVLTGLIASLIAQGLDAAAGAWMGCYLHGAAGDTAAGELGHHGTIAGDLVDFLPGVIEELE